MDVFEYSESDVLYTQLSLFQKFMKRHSLDKMTALQLFEENEQGYLEEDAFERMCSFRKVFKGIELNPREVLFEKIPKAICHDNSGDAVFENVTLQIEEIKKYMDNNLVNAKKKTAVQVKSIFGARADESLGACLKNWYSKQSEKSKSHIYAENITGFMTYIEKLTTNDDGSHCRPYSYALG